MKNKKKNLYYMLLFKNSIAYFVSSFIVISILSVVREYLSTNGFYEICNIVIYFNQIVVYLLSLILVVFIAKISIKKYMFTKPMYIKLLWLFINCFFSFLIFWFTDLFILVLSLCIYPLED